MGKYGSIDDWTQQNLSARRIGDAGGSLQARLDFTPAASDLAHALRGRETRAQKILARLRQGPANSQEMMAVGGLRFGARILELRQAGHKITTEEHAEFAVYRLEEGA